MAKLIDFFLALSLFGARLHYRVSMPREMVGAYPFTLVGLRVEVHQSYSPSRLAAEPGLNRKEGLATYGPQNSVE
jgi:VanZ family protein